MSYMKAKWNKHSVIIKRFAEGVVQFVAKKNIPQIQTMHIFDLQHTLLIEQWICMNSILALWHNSPGTFVYPFPVKTPAC